MMPRLRPQTGALASLAAAAMLVWAAPAPAASPLEGLWRTATDEGQVQIEACGQALCGRIVTSRLIRADPAIKDSHNRDRRLRDRPLKDLLLLRGFVGGPSTWRDGTLYNPEDGGAYHGTIRLIDADTLRLTGCIVAPLCRSQTWTRIR